MVKKMNLSPKINLILYGLLLIFTPFLMLRNYLQDLIGTTSHSKLNFIGMDIPYILIVLFVVIIIFVVKTRKNINKRVIICWGIAIAMWLLGQQISDYYLNHSFYDLQHNWHYIAYGIYTFIAYNALSGRYKNTTRLIYAIFLQAFLLSTFDEVIQIFLTNRVFDVSDIAKDLWGTVAGIIIVFIGYNKPEIIQKGWRIREDKIKKYFDNSLSAIIIIAIFTFILLFVSSNLSDSIYVFYTIFITLMLFVFVLLLIHFSNKNPWKWGVIGVLIILLSLQTFSIIKNHKKNITLNKSGITVYKGIPLVYFDAIIHENGLVRYVDKKTYFNQGDLRFLFDKTSNILLMGCGGEQIGSLGFPKKFTSQFIYNDIKQDFIQVIILPTKEACKKFNELKSEGKKVTFIIHNTQKIDTDEKK